jgi:hypothetical protein
MWNPLAQLTAEEHRGVNRRLAIGVVFTELAPLVEDYG